MQWHNETQTNLHSLNNGMFEVYFELCCSFVFSPPLCWLIYSKREQRRIPTLSGERKKSINTCTMFEASFEYSFLMHLMCNRCCSLCTYTEFTQFSSEFCLHLIYIKYRWYYRWKVFSFKKKMSLLSRGNLFHFPSL